MPDPLPPPSVPAAEPGVPDSPRLVSVDALRGFDMFWIMGADSLGHALGHMSGRPVVQLIATQLDHVEWQGFRFYDLIFPLFVFIVGVSLVFSLTKIIEQSGKDSALVRLLRRSALLYVIGLFYYGGLAGKHTDAGWSGLISDIRLLGVLQRIAICYFWAGFLFIFYRPRTLVIAFMALLVGYWAAMNFIPVPGFGAGNLEEGKNLANWIDARWLPGRKWDGDHDPEGILSTFPAIATCLLGVFAGLFLKAPEPEPRKKALILAGAGVASLAVGFLWSLQFPIIKKLWTSSYVLVAGGWSLLLSAFYGVIDVWKKDRWCQPFIWIGMNAIAVYLASNLVDFNGLAAQLAGGDVRSFLDRSVTKGFGDFVLSLVSIVLVLWLARTLYRRRVFIRL